jgi:hypothetical protein
MNGRCNSLTLPSVDLLIDGPANALAFLHAAPRIGGTFLQERQVPRARRKRPS